MKYLLFTLLFLFGNSWAWPIFSFPDWGALNKANALDATSCPAGFAKIKKHVIIPVEFEQYPQVGSWQWQALQTTPCLPQNQPLPFTHYEIQKTYDPIESYVLYSTVNAHFNFANKNFTLQITTPKESWDCMIEKNYPKLIICANDI